MFGKFQFLFLIFAFVSSAFLRAESSLWKQPIRSEEDQVKFLLHMEKEIPSLFEGMVDFDTNLFQTLIWQQKFVDEVAMQSEHTGWSQKEPELKKYKIRLMQREASDTSKASGDPKSLSRLKTDIEAGLRELEPASGQSLRQAILVKLTELAKLESGKQFDGAAAEFRAVVPASENKIYLPLSPDEKIKYLTEKLLPIVTSDEEKVKKQVEQLIRIRARDERIKHLAAVAVALGDSDELKTKEELKTKLDSMDLPIQFGTPERVRAGLEKLLDSVPTGTAALSMADRKTKFNLAKGSLSQHTGEFKDFAEKKPQVVQEVTVTEVPASHGVMRGCVGNDCASKNLVAYSNLPESRVVFIDTGKGHPSGYGEIAYVNSGADKKTAAQYFSSFNGKALSGETVDLVVRGLDAIKGLRGVERSLVLRPDQLKYNTNYDLIREAYLQMMGHDEIVPIEFKDADVRRAAKPYVAVDNYHSPDKIRTALPYAPKALPDGQSIEVVVEEAHTPEIDLSQPVDKGAALRVALELEAATEKPQYTDIQLKNLNKRQEHVDYDHNARLELRDAFLRAAHIPKEKFQETLDVLANKDHLPEEEYLKKAQEWLKAMGYEMDPNFKKTRIEPYLLGLSRAPDAFQSRYKDKLVSGALWLLQKGKHKEEVAKVIAAHPELFRDNVRLGNMLLDQSRFENTRLYYPAWQMAETLSRGGYQAESKPELLETLLSKLKTKDDRYQRKAAAGMLLKLKSHIPEATKALQEMLFETPGDLEIEQLLKETDSFSASGSLSCKSRLGSLGPH